MSKRYAVALIATIATLAMLPLSGTSSAPGANHGNQYYLCPPIC
jgi:hypothetical protein